MKVNFIYCFLFTVFSMLSACKFQENSYEEEMLVAISKASVDGDEAIFKLSNYFDFTWDMVCFHDGPEVVLFFYFNNVINEKYTLSENRFYMQEEYVKNSPADKCYGRGFLFLVEEKSTIKNKDIFLLKHALGE